MIRMVRLNLSLLLRRYLSLKNEIVAKPMITKESRLTNMTVLCICERILNWNCCFIFPHLNPVFTINEMACTSNTKNRKAQNIYENKEIASIHDSFLRAIITTLLFTERCHNSS